MRETIINSFERYWKNILDRVPEITVDLILLLLFIFVGILVRRLLVNRLTRHEKDQLPIVSLIVNVICMPRNKIHEMN